MKKLVPSLGGMNQKDSLSVYVLIVLLLAFAFFGVPGLVMMTGDNITTKSTMTGDIPANAHVLETTNYTVVERIVNIRNDTLHLYCTDKNGNNKIFDVPYDAKLNVGDTIAETSYEIVENYWGIVRETLVVGVITSLVILLLFFAWIYCKRCG